MKTADDILIEAGETFRQRRAVYGDNWKRAGAVMAAMFPNGIKMVTAADHDSFHILSLIVVKLTRYAVSLDRGEFHQDSVHDAAVYCAMLEMIESQKAEGGIRHGFNCDRPGLCAGGGSEGDAAKPDVAKPVA